MFILLLLIKFTEFVNRIIVRVNFDARILRIIFIDLIIDYTFLPCVSLFYQHICNDLAFSVYFNWQFIWHRQ